jgi:hypothetical protein
MTMPMQNYSSTGSIERLDEPQPETVKRRDELSDDESVAPEQRFQHRAHPHPRQSRRGTSGNRPQNVARGWNEDKNLLMQQAMIGAKVR